MGLETTDLRNYGQFCLKTCKFNLKKALGNGIILTVRADYLLVMNVYMHSILA